MIKCSGLHCRCMDIGGACPNMHSYHCKEHNPDAYEKGGTRPQVQLEIVQGKWNNTVALMLVDAISAPSLRNDAKLLDLACTFVQKKLDDGVQETVELIRNQTASQARPVRIGENDLAMKELGIPMESIKLHNSHCDGFLEGWEKKTAQVDIVLNSLSPKK